MYMQMFWVISNALNLNYTKFRKDRSDAIIIKLYCTYMYLTEGIYEYTNDFIGIESGNAFVFISMHLFGCLSIG